MSLPSDFGSLKLERLIPKFFFFSNRLGCASSLAVTLIGTLILLLAFGWIGL